MVMATMGFKFRVSGFKFLASDCGRPMPKFWVKFRVAEKDFTLERETCNAERS
jgi:hypothetical protein